MSNAGGISLLENRLVDLKGDGGITLMPFDTNLYRLFSGQFCHLQVSTGLLYDSDDSETDDNDEDHLYNRRGQM